MGTRRDFLKKGGAALFSIMLADKIMADPYSRILLPKNNAHFTPVKIKGRIKSSGKGISDVVVSDGISIAKTNRGGEFEILSGGEEKFVFMSIPRGYKINTSVKGTADFYKKIIPDKNGEMFTEFIIEKNESNDNEHSFLLLADPQTLDEEDMNLFHNETIPDVQQMIKELPNVFGVSCGDLMFDNLELFPDYEDGISKTGIPFFQVLGNHDVEIKTKTDELSVRTFERFFGPAYYSFNRGEIHYAVLDDIFWFGGYIGYLTEKQLNWLKADLDQIEKGKTVVVFVHIPPHSEYTLRAGQASPNNLIVTNKELLYRVLEPYNSFVICGHLHISEYLKESGINIHTCGAVCGAWWTGPICSDGTPRGYSIYKVKGSDLKWEYKSSGFKEDYQMKIYPPKSELNDSEQIISNIWGADSSWKVYWYEDGIRKGSAEKRNGLDPLAAKLYTGHEKPEKHKWADPSVTDHLFYIKPQNKDAKIIIEAANGFGKKYSNKV
jgi:hypothetical protein